MWFNSDLFTNDFIENIFYILLTAFVITLFELGYFYYVFVSDISLQLRQDIIYQCYMLKQKIKQKSKQTKNEEIYNLIKEFLNKIMEQKTLLNKGLTYSSKYNDANNIGKNAVILLVAMFLTLLYFVYGYLTSPLSLNTNFYLFCFSIAFLILYQLYFRDVIAPTYTFGSIKDMVMSDKFTENPELHKLTIVLSEYFRKKD